jgi:hypothetical protein
MQQSRDRACGKLRAFACATVLLCGCGFAASQVNQPAPDEPDPLYVRQSMERIWFGSWDCERSAHFTSRFMVETSGAYQLHMRPRSVCGRSFPYIPAWNDFLASADCLWERSLAVRITVRERGLDDPVFDVAEARVLVPKTQLGIVDYSGVKWLVPSNELYLGPVLVLQQADLHLQAGKEYRISIDAEFDENDVPEPLAIAFELVRLVVTPVHD